MVGVEMINNHYLSILLLIIIVSLSALSITTHLSSRRTPCPESYPVIGNLMGFIKNRHRFHDWVTDMLANTPTLTLQVNGFLNLSHGICTADPANIHHLLRSNFPNYIKGSRFTTVLEELLGNGIFNSDGQLWSGQRKIASHEFSTKSLRTFISETLQSQLSESFIPRLNNSSVAASSDQDTIIDLQQALRKFSFHNICSVAFGIDPEISSSSSSSNINLRLFIQAFDAAVEHTSNRFMSPLPMVWKINRFFNIGNERRFKEAIQIVNDFANNIINLKEAQSDDHSRSNEDLLSRFMASSRDMGFNDGERRRFLRDIIISFILAGKDSTATALTWFFWLLEAQPHCKHLIYKEFSTHIDPKNLNFDDLKELNYLHAALSESMRLFPPVPINSRLTVDDDMLPDGTYVGKGWFADYSAYAMGRMERIWGSDCREFKPERWLDGNGVYQPLDQFKYPVFHGGFRMCLGKEMAYLQMKSVVIAIMYEFEVEVIDGGGTIERMLDPPYSLSLLLSMKNGLPVRLKRRRQHAE
uniref:cytochrome P450 94A1-like n=1 Tax=Erigeron canadensis TaxID=72917 RepID=UPI001CB8A162|nr:cytochrome P450 94A1-like [Erigeron canadensis]